VPAADQIDQAFFQLHPLRVKQKIYLYETKADCTLMRIHFSVTNAPKQQAFALTRKKISGRLCAYLPAKLE
jgi:hypothetical protein